MTAAPLSDKDLEDIIRLVEVRSGVRVEISDIRDRRRGRPAPDRGVQVRVQHAETRHPRSGSFSLYILTQNQQLQWEITDLISGIA